MNLEHHPGPYDHLVSKDDTNEKALQRAIIALKFSKLDDEIISWIDIELPMQEGKTKRFDMIGESADGKYVLCELKFAKGENKSSTPEEATASLLEYKNAVVDYAKRLKAANQNFNLHTNANAAYPQLDLDKCINKPIRLIVAANKKYWEMHPGFSKNPSVEYASINVEEDWFSKRAEKATEPDGTYQPTMPEFARIWSIV